ncbi:MAG: hypothetical protein FD134_339 [Gallionellaceae bacterium]|nr:MAG: hypothetical protein FD134_339 [Gallionellaceae bacterium]
MKLHLSCETSHNLFTAHGDGYVAVGGERHERPVVVVAEAVFTDWQPPGFDALTEAHFDYFLALKPAVLLFGTGARQRFPHPGLYRSLIAAGVGVEFMCTPAVCRTYNILLAEGRRVAAAVLL